MLSCIGRKGSQGCGQAGHHWLTNLSAFAAACAMYALCLALLWTAMLSHVILHKWFMNSDDADMRQCYIWILNNNLDFTKNLTFACVLKIQQPISRSTHKQTWYLAQSVRPMAVQNSCQLRLNASNYGKIFYITYWQISYLHTRSTHTLMLPFACFGISHCSLSWFSFFFILFAEGGAHRPCFLPSWILPNNYPNAIFKLWHSTFCL